MAAASPATAPAPAAMAAPAETVIHGEASDLAKGYPLYSEEHQEWFQAGRLAKMRTLYRDPAGKPVAERMLDFSASSTRPRYSLRDTRTGHEEDVAFENGRVRIRYLSSRGGKPKEKILDVPEPLVIDGGFHPFLVENWSALTAGKKVAFNFVVPSRLDYFRFVAYEDHVANPDGKERVFTAIPENGLLRMLVEPIVTHYRSDTRRMSQYQGLSNLTGPDGKSLKVRLVYGDAGL